MQTNGRHGLSFLKSKERTFTMQHVLSHLSSTIQAGFLKKVTGFATLAGLCLAASSLSAQTYYDFDRGTNTGWLMSSAHPSTITYPADSMGGHAFRLQGRPQTNASDINARVFAIYTNRLYTNFYASVDVVSWNTNQDCDQVVGILARVNSNQALQDSSPLYFPGPLDPDLPNGVSFNARLHDYRSYLGTGNTNQQGSAEQMSTWGIVNGYGTLSLGNPVAVTQTRFRWVPGHTYRLVISSTNRFGDAPSYFTSSIYDGNDLTRPLLTMTGDDTYSGNYWYIPQYGYVGVFAYKLNGSDFDPTVDITFDNFYVGETAPATAVAAPAIPHGKLGTPQVINRVPASFKNFHPAASGISFNATTLTTTNAIDTTAIKLVLNGVDVSAALQVSGPATNAAVTYAGLAPNTVYRASIVLRDTLGRNTTNEWRFDTFSDAYLASSAVKVIEAEDYDFGGGFYIDDPIVSGYTHYDPTTDNGIAVNDGIGYVDQPGHNARTDPPGDFFSYDSGARATEAAYRHADPIGTQQGNFGTYVGADSTQGSGIAYSQSYDTQRSKYSSVDPTLQEYIVERTQGGQWLNYTRIFSGTAYNVYLRAAAGLAQPIRLDQIVADTATNYLGTFNVDSTFYNNNYGYTPLMAADGSLAVVKLPGTNTVRLTFDSPANNATQYGSSLNYFVLVPAGPQLYSSASAAGPYLPETGVLVDTTLKKLTVPKAGATRFYRIAANPAVRVSNITVSGANVVLDYQ